MPKRTANQYQSSITPDHMIHGVDPHRYQELHQLLEDTARDIIQATTNTAPWPDLIIHLLQTLETHTTREDCFPERLVTLCERITRYLNTGDW